MPTKECKLNMNRKLQLRKWFKIDFYLSTGELAPAAFMPVMAGPAASSLDPNLNFKKSKKSPNKLT